MKLFVYFLEKIMDSSSNVPVLKQMEMMRHRNQGDMVLLVSDFSREVLMQKYYAYANVFLADGGLFGFGGCHCLFSDQSEEKLYQLKNILDDQKLSYCLRVEDESACGGKVTYACNDTSFVKDEYVLVCQKPDTEFVRKAVSGLYEVKKKEDYCIFLATEKKKQEAIETIARELSVSEVVWED